MTAAPDATRQTVREKYGEIAATESSCCGGGGCCGPTMSVDELAAKIGYDPEQLRALPETANLGLSCGNPTAIANLRPGQTVLDLGSGAGFDVFLAGPKVGPNGRVIGVDMTAAMIDRARAGLDHYQQRTGLDNVEFRLGEIEHLPVADASVDVVISNCVINLSSDKPAVWREIARVLKPGGAVAVSDIALKRELPDEVRQMVEALIGCVARALLIDAYRAMLADAGLRDVTLTEKPDYVAALENSGDPLYQRIAAALPTGTRASDCIVSVDVTARR